MNGKELSNRHVPTDGQKSMNEQMPTHGQDLVLTSLVRGGREYQVCALFEGNRLLEAEAHPKEDKPLIGGIYVGRVRDIVKSLNAAFIEIAPGLACYYPLDELRFPVYAKKCGSKMNRLVPGDELCVQVEREAIKTKPPKVTTNLSFHGNWMVLMTERREFGISRKLPLEMRHHGKELLSPLLPSEFGLILRTNSQNATDGQLVAELAGLVAQARDLMAKAAHRTCFSLLLGAKPAYLDFLLHAPQDRLQRIVTDDASAYEAISDFLETQGSPLVGQLELREEGGGAGNDSLPLRTLYGLEKKLDEALQERVWLKSGGYLVIQPTEALTVIDVNSGKSTSGQSQSEHSRKVNLEAAREIAFQLRLRNLSGIIIIDFIDMDTQEDNNELLEALRQCTRDDPVPVRVMGMTRLGLVELTRKKGKKSLREQFGS